MTLVNLCELRTKGDIHDPVQGILIPLTLDPDQERETNHIQGQDIPTLTLEVVLVRGPGDLQIHAPENPSIQAPDKGVPPPVPAVITTQVP